MESSAFPVARRVSPGRVALVAAGLMGGGAVAGAAAGALGSILWVAATESLRVALDHRIWMAAGLVGAPLGAILLPLTGFTALGRVPLGRLVGTTVVATALGGAIGAALSGAWLGGALAGFAAATAWLWYRSRRASN